MDSNLFRASRNEEVESLKSKKDNIDEKIDIFIKIQRNKDNLCSSLFEIENFLCKIKQVSKFTHLFKFLK